IQYTRISLGLISFIIPSFSYMQRTGTAQKTAPVLIFTLFIRHINKFDKMIAFHYLEIFYDSWIQWLCRLSKFCFNQPLNLCYCFLSVNQRPDKSSLCIQMNFSVTRLSKYLLSNTVKKPGIFNFQNY